MESCSADLPQSVGLGLAKNGALPLNQITQLQRSLEHFLSEKIAAEAMRTYVFFIRLGSGG
jgi:hypothetical protein